MRIAVDAMGGDHAPRAVVAGTVLAAREFTDTEFILVGDETVLPDELSTNDGSGLPNIRLSHAPQVIGMADAPVEAVRGKRKSSITLSVKLVADGQAEAVVSAGNTGAMVAAATVLLGQLGEIKRSGIAVSFPAHAGTTTIIDVGANIHCRPIHLLQYGIMATIYSEQILGIKKARVGLLNIGSEDKKGNDLVRETKRLLGEHRSVNFVGNIEGYDIHRGVCDVAVCEGFVGNVILKVAEGLSGSLLDDVEDACRKALPAKSAELGVVVQQLRRRNDYAEYGGAPLLGVNGICIIGHGTSDARAVYNALRVARGFGGNQVNRLIAEAV
jgi:glycerol-3-phosphate acyltransferase PlsX